VLSLQNAAMELPSKMNLRTDASLLDRFVQTVLFRKPDTNIGALYGDEAASSLKIFRSRLIPYYFDGATNANNLSSIMASRLSGYKNSDAWLKLLGFFFDKNRGNLIFILLRSSL
jgi:hypothetical protein